MYYYKEPLPFLDEIEENLKVGILDIMILKLLTERELYGYEIKQLIFERSNQTILIKEGSLYGPLYRMGKKEFLLSLFTFKSDYLLISKLILSHL